MGTKGNTKLMENSGKEAPIIGARRHLHDEHRSMLDARTTVKSRRMQALELLDDHRLAHATLTIQEQTGHAGAARLLDQFLEAIERTCRAGVAHPVGCPDLADPIVAPIECPFPNPLRQVRQIQRHRRVPGMPNSIGKSRASRE